MDKFYKPTLLLFVSITQLSLQQIYGSEKGHSSKSDVLPNVLFVCVDDLRPAMGCYGNPAVQSPNIDKLASEGYLFTNHFVQVPTCGASRFSLLTGMLTRKRSHLSNDVMKDLLSGQSETESPETFIHHMRRNGYYTVGIGKISHYADGLVYGYEEEPSDQRELPHSWDELIFDARKWGTGWNAFFGYANGENRQSMDRQVKPYEKAYVDDTGYPDGLTANMALQKLGELAKRQEPFFLGLGFFKPHLPFNAPGKYWDLYDEQEIPLSPNPFIPDHVNKASLHNSGEFNGYQAGDEKASLEGPVSDDYARKIRHAYFACVSYIDAQIGKLLERLEDLELAENTIVIIWGNHGWHLGDQLVWGKHTIFERALKSVFIIKLPGNAGGRVVDRVVSSVDIYPTLMELCNIDMPHQTDGHSLADLLNNDTATWEEASYGYYRNGITLRTARYRLTKYFRSQEPVIELYDHLEDLNETRNIAAGNPEIVERLMPLWEKGNTGLY